MDDSTLSTATRREPAALGSARDDTLTQQERVPASELPYAEDTPPEFAGEAPRKSKRRQTAHLKLVPQSKELRESLAARAARGGG